MPYVMSSGIRIGETADAVLSDLGVSGAPDRRRVPVRVRLVSEGVLCVDDDPRASFGAWAETVPLPFLSACTARNAKEALARALTRTP